MKTPDCAVGKLLASVSAPQREVVQMILDDTEGYSAQFAGVCLGQVRAGLPIEHWAVADHRHGHCDCPPEES